MNRRVHPAAVVACFAVVGTTGVSSSAQNQTPQPPCHCLLQSGCGSGGGFCSGTLTITDVGCYSCENGKGGELQSWPRKCYTASEFTTFPCGTTPPSGTVLGCSQGGVCCSARNYQQTSNGCTVTGNMNCPNPSAGACTTQD